MKKEFLSHLLVPRKHLATCLVLVCGVLTAAQNASQPKFTVKPLALPGSTGLVVLDYFAHDAVSHRVWVPAGNTGNVDVIDTTNDNVAGIPGFATGQVEFRGKPRVMGPSSVSVGDGVVFIGNRANSQICMVDARALKKGECIAVAPVSAGLAAAPDGLIYIAATKELWVTSGAPPLGIPAAELAIKIFDASQPGHLKPAGKIPLPGSAEGYAVDNEHGLFYTNLEEIGRTIAIDVRKRTVLSNWRSCDDPSGVAVDQARGFVFVACVDHILALDIAHDGRVLGSLMTGAGVDNIDYSEEDQLLYVAAATAAKLTIAKVDDHGAMSALATVPTTAGVRSVIAAGHERAYLIDPIGGRILKVERQ